MLLQTWSVRCSSLRDAGTASAAATPPIPRDVKRASDRKGDPVASFHDAHDRFLAIAKRAPEVVVKVVVTLDTRDDEIDEMCERISKAGGGVSLVVQPVTPAGAVVEAPGANRLLPLVTRIERVVPGVRLIPQTHKLYGAL